jgi:hypothetical protein
LLSLLFYKFSIFDVLQHRQELVKEAVGKLTEADMKGHTPEEIVRDVAAIYKFEIPVIEEEQAHVSYREVSVDVSQDPMRMIWDRSEPFNIKGTEITFSLPFKGDANLFQVRPATFDMNPPRGEIRGSEIRLIQTRTDENAAAAKSQYEQSVKSIRQYLGWLEASISDFNGKIGAQVQTLVNARREQLAARAGMVAQLGIPIKQPGQGTKEVTINPDKEKQVAKSLKSSRKWDVFISHATEDKDDFVRPLAQRLKSRGVTVWFDEFSLKMGDSIRASIDFGLANSRYGVVVLSKHFFGRHWPVQELNGLSTRERAGKSIILPIWHNITHDEVEEHSPILADKLAVRSDAGLDAVVTSIMEKLDEQQL